MQSTCVRPAFRCSCLLIPHPHCITCCDIIYDIIIKSIAIRTAIIYVQYCGIHTFFADYKQCICFVCLVNWINRFAQFFLCPLFNADAKDREINAVNSGECRDEISFFLD